MSLLKKAQTLKDQQAERIKTLEALIDQQEKQLQALRNSKFEIPKAAKRPPRSLKQYVRIIIPDTHGSIISQEAWPAVLRDIQTLSPMVRECILMGDHLDCGGFLAQHHVLGYVADTEYTFQDDVNAANQFLDQVQAACPKARITYLEGNHEHRLEKWCVDTAVGKGIDAEMLRRMFGCEAQLSLAKRGIEFIRAGERYDGLQVRGVIKRGNCHFLHGARHGKNAVAETLRDFGGNVVMAHIHRAGQASTETVSGGTHWGWCPGALCERHPRWRHSATTGWTDGYGAQFVQESDDFLHINVPVISGKSFLLQLAERVT